MSLGKIRDWREICEDVLKERNPDKTDALLEELLHALEERAARPGLAREDASKPS